MTSAQGERRALGLPPLPRKLAREWRIVSARLVRRVAGLRRELGLVDAAALPVPLLREAMRRVVAELEHDAAWARTGASTVEAARDWSDVPPHGA